MRLSYGMVFRLFSDLLGIDAEKSIALTGRLKHFQRAGFPAGSNVGPGPRAAYGIGEVFALAFAFRLLALRHTPRDAIAAVDGNFTLICRLVLQAWERRQAGDDGAGVADDQGPALLRVAADGLEDLRRPDFEAGPADAMVQVDQRQVWAWMRGVDPLPPEGLVMLDVDAIVAETLGAIERLGIATPLAVGTGFANLRSMLVAAGKELPTRFDH